MLTSRTAAMTSLGQRRISQAASSGDRDPHRLEVLVHVEADGADLHHVGHHEEGHQPDRQEAAMRDARQEQRQQGKQRRASPGWWRRRRGPPTVRRPSAPTPSPTTHFSAPLPPRLQHGRDRERDGQQRTAPAAARRSAGHRGRRVGRSPATQPSASARKAGKKKKWNGASSAPSRPARKMSAGRSRQPAARARAEGSPATSRRTAPTSIGRPGRGGPMDEEPRPHHRGDAEDRATRSATSCRTSCAVTRLGRSPNPLAMSPTSRIQPKPAAEDDEHRRQQRRSPRAAAAKQRARQAVDEQRERAGQDRRRDHEAGDREDPRRAGDDGGVEIGEPVVDERLAGEVRHLRREVARVERLGDREVDPQVAPVRAAGRDPVRGRAPEPGLQDRPHEARAAAGHGERQPVATKGVPGGGGLVEDRAAPAAAERRSGSGGPAGPPPRRSSRAGSRRSRSRASRRGAR